jgi:hypothetical protein
VDHAVAATAKHELEVADVLRIGHGGLPSYD